MYCPPDRLFLEKFIIYIIRVSRKSREKRLVGNNDELVFVYIGNSCILQKIVYYNII